MLKIISPIHTRTTHTYTHIEFFDCMTSIQVCHFLYRFLDMNGSLKRSSIFWCFFLFCSNSTKKEEERNCLIESIVWIFTLEYPTLTERNSNLFGRELFLGRLYFNIFNYYCFVMFGCVSFFLSSTECILLFSHDWALCLDECAASQKFCSFWMGYGDPNKLLDTSIEIRIGLENNVHRKLQLKIQRRATKYFFRVLSMFVCRPFQWHTIDDSMLTFTQFVILMSERIECSKRWNMKVGLTEQCLLNGWGLNKQIG